jgi:hypothetical protein
MDRPRPELAAMGERGRCWAKEVFDWNTIATHMEAAYRGLIATHAKGPH